MPTALAVAATAQLLAQLWVMPAVGAPSEDALVRTMRVSTRGIDLGTAAGQSLLRRRIEGAAQKVCGAFDQPLASLSGDYIACHDRSVALASAQLQVMTARATSRGAKRIAEAGEQRR